MLEGAVCLKGGRHYFGSINKVGVIVFDLTRDCIPNHSDLHIGSVGVLLGKDRKRGIVARKPPASADLPPPEEVVAHTLQSGIVLTHTVLRNTVLLDFKKGSTSRA